MEYFAADYAEFSSVDNGNNNNSVHFTVDDLLDFSKADETMTDAFFWELAGQFRRFLHCYGGWLLQFVGVQLRSQFDQREVQFEYFISLEDQSCPRCGEGEEDKGEN